MNDKIRQLETEIRRHQKLYYNAEPEISDEQFDRLWDELHSLDPDNSLFSEIGVDESPNLAKRRHVMPMNSQDKASNPEAFLVWARKVAHAQYVVQYKLDGASIELQYDAGRFLYAVTRGDGKVGDDVTTNVAKMSGVRPTIETGFSGGVRGEVMMSRTVHREHYPEKANCRNAANGIMKRKDGVGSEMLDVYVYDAWHTGADSYFADEREKIGWLDREGFTVVPTVFFSSPDEVIAYRDRVLAERADLDLDIDGLVVKGVAIDIDDMQRARPEKQIAFKFSPEEGVTRLAAVEWSESGHLYTPIGILDPVRLAGTTVRRANLVHRAHIVELGIQIGSLVRVTKRGEIIPKIEQLVENPPETTPIELPTTCGTCGATLVDDDTRLFCPNVACPKRAYHRIRKWLDVNGVRDFGDVLLGRLFESGRVQEIADLYSLTESDIVAFERMGEAIAKKALGNLYAANELPLARFIAGFDIEGIGEKILEKVVAAGYDTLDKLAEATRDDLSRIDGIGETTAAAILTGVSLLRDEMSRVLETGRISITAPNVDGALSGISFCFTGPLESITRAAAEDRIVSSGGTVKSSVVRGLGYLVTNDPESGSAKNRKARDLGIPIISEQEFLEFIKK